MRPVAMEQNSGNPHFAETLAIYSESARFVFAREGDKFDRLELMRQGAQMAEGQPALEAAAFIEPPEWVPCAVVHEAKKLAAGADLAGRTVLRSLLTDPRMRNVWVELTKYERENHKRTERYYYSPSVPSLLDPLANKARSLKTLAAELRMRNPTDCSAADLEKISASLEAAALEPDRPAVRATALAYFFSQAYHFAIWQPKTITRSEIARADALVDADDPLVIERLRSDRIAQGYARTMAETARELWGPQLHGLIAVIANVALGRNDLKTASVREWCRSKRQRKMP